MIGKPISDPNLDYVLEAFQALFGTRGRQFGTTYASVRGISDSAQGVQWNAGVYDKLGSKAWLGVNLEGMKYRGWPIACFIERELDSPSLVDLCRSIPDCAMITMSWWRDAWQYSARPPIHEQHIRHVPISLASLTPDVWREILLEAYQCLNPDKHHRGRARQIVTLKSGQVEKEVSPHLRFSYIIWPTIPQTFNEAEAAPHHRLLPAAFPVYLKIKIPI